MLPQKCVGCCKSYVMRYNQKVSCEALPEDLELVFFQLIFPKRRILYKHNWKTYEETTECMWLWNYIDSGLPRSPPAQNQLDTPDHMVLGQTQEMDINTHAHTPGHFFPPSDSESLNKTGKLECLCSKAWFPESSSFRSLGKSALWPLQGPTRSSCHLALDTVCVCVCVCVYMCALVRVCVRIHLVSDQFKLSAIH